MSRFIGFSIFGVLVFLIYIVFQYALGHWLGLNDLINKLQYGFTAGTTMGVVLLVGYSLLASWVLIGLGRWLFGCAFTVVESVQNILDGTRQQAATAKALETELIIDSPALKTPLMRIIETVFSAVVWVFFIYIFQTILAAGMWLLGLEHIYSYNFTKDSIGSTLDAMVFALYTAIVSMIFLVGWAKWNLWRYGGMDRRRPRTLVTHGEVAKVFSIPVDIINQMQVAKLATIQPIPSGIVYNEILGLKDCR